MSPNARTNKEKTMTMTKAEQALALATHRYSATMVEDARNIGFAAAAMGDHTEETSTEGKRVIESQVARLVERGQAILDKLADAKIPTMLDTIDTSDARHVLWHFGDYVYGIQPGSFVASLITTLTHADLRNRIRLTGAFPGVGLAVGMMMTTPDGHEQLCALIESRKG